MTRTIIAVAVVAAVTAACGGGGETTTVPSTAAVEQSDSGTSSSVPESTTLPEVTPTALGDLVGGTYLAAMQDVVSLLADRPDASTVETEVLALKERYVGELVELGRLREALEPEGHSAVDARTRSIVNGISADLFTEFQEIHAHYQAADPAMAELVASFSIITQYADFELLTQQDPDEAARVLGD